MLMGEISVPPKYEYGAFSPSLCLVVEILMVADPPYKEFNLPYFFGIILKM
jgi:hypothetical protein